MSTDKLKLLLTEREVEVLRDALELYLQTQPVPMDRRFEYRYRAAQTVLESLREGSHELATLPRGDDEEASLFNDERPARRPLREQTED